MQKLSFWTKLSTFLRKKIRITGSSADSYERLWGLELSRISTFFFALLLFLIVFFFSYLILSYTPLKSILPDEAMERDKASIEAQYKKIKQLEQKVELQTRYLNDFKNVILGKPIPSDKAVNIPKDSLKGEKVILSTHIGTSEKEFSKKIETEIKENTSIERAKQSAKGVFFFAPIRGVISSGFSKKHPGVDVVAKENSPVKSIYNGIVIFSDWTQDNGYTIIIRHPNDFLSIYKHNSLLLKQQGDKLRAGDPIAIVGNTGENSSATHLHFELFFEGKSVNPLEFISFR